MLLSKILISLALIIPLTDFEGVTAATKEIECREENLYRQLYSNNPRLKQEKDITDRKFTPRSILKALLSCNIYVGDLRVSHRGYKYDDENENVREEHLEYLRNLTKITGHVELDLKYYQRFQSLSFLANVKEFYSSLPHGFVLLSSNISALNFSNIKFNVGCYDIRDNKNLCYLENFKTINPKLKSCYSHDSPLQIDKDIDVCRKEGKICDSCYCDAQAGCWGPGARRCFRCKDWKAGEVCVTSCSEIKGYYSSKEVINKECKRCHDSCEYCKGPKEEDCLKVQGSNDIYYIIAIIFLIIFLISRRVFCKICYDLGKTCRQGFKDRFSSNTNSIEQTDKQSNGEEEVEAKKPLVAEAESHTVSVYQCTYGGDNYTASSENGISDENLSSGNQISMLQSQSKPEGIEMLSIDSQILSSGNRYSKLSSQSEPDNDGGEEDDKGDKLLKSKDADTSC